jgi:hypothetical protein
MEQFRPDRRGRRRGSSRQGHGEGRAATGLALDPDPAAMGPDDLLADRQAGPRPLEFLARVQSAKIWKILVWNWGSMPMPMSLT